MSPINNCASPVCTVAAALCIAITHTRPTIAQLRRFHLVWVLRDWREIALFETALLRIAAASAGAGEAASLCIYPTAGGGSGGADSSPEWLGELIKELHKFVKMVSIDRHVLTRALPIHIVVWV
jgi:hypothetical protein